MRQWSLAPCSSILLGLSRAGKAVLTEAIPLPNRSPPAMSVHRLLWVLLHADVLRPMRRLKWQSGQPFDGMYDAAPTTLNDTSFLRIDGNQLVIDCKRCAPPGRRTLADL